MPHEKGTYQCPTTQCPIRHPAPRRSHNRRTLPAQRRFRPRGLRPEYSGRPKVLSPRHRIPEEIHGIPPAPRQARVPLPIVVDEALEAGEIAAVLPAHVPMAMTHLARTRVPSLLTSAQLPVRQPQSVRTVRRQRHLHVRRSATAALLRSLLRRHPRRGRGRTALLGSPVRETATDPAAGGVVGVEEVVRATLRVPSRHRVDRTAREVGRSNASHNRADVTVPPNPNGPSKPFLVVVDRTSTRRRSSDGRAGSATGVRSGAIS